MKTRPIKKLPIIEARDEYLNSFEGKLLCDVVSLGVPPENQRFLFNRIEKAFLQGWAAKTKEVKKRVRDFVA